jgi:transposase-like protein/ribosomal protein L37AE/L43A
MGGVEDYPETASEFGRRFSSEEACWDYLVQLRWPDGFRCPSCNGDRAWRTARKLFHCQGCEHEVSVTAGTILQDTRKPLRLWFQVMWWVVGQKNGASALGLNRVLGVGCYETAWTWLHKLRRAMVRPGRESLSGEVEVDETFVGGVEEGGGRRHIGSKALVAIAAEIRGDGIGRIRMKRIQDASADTLMSFVRESVVKGGTIVSDGLQSYRALPEAGYRHRRRVIEGSGKEAHVVLPRVHRVAALLKRWLLGTHQGAVSRDHLDYYLDEFTFRFNRRASQHRGKLFYRLVQQAVAVDPTPYDAIVKHIRGPKKRNR